MNNYKNIPATLKGVPKWVVYGKTNTKEICPLKKPYNAKNGRPAKVNDPKTWATFEECKNEVKKCNYCGLGYVFTGDYTVIDLDSVIDRKGNILPQALEIVDKLDSYTEYSLSKRGLHIIIKNNTDINASTALPVNQALMDIYAHDEIDRSDGKVKHKVPGIEIYTTGKYIALTGDIMDGRKIIKEGSWALKKIYEEYFDKEAPSEPKAKAKAKEDTQEAHTDLPELTERDRQILYMIDKGKNRAKIFALLMGEWEGRYQSQSNADLALCNYLAFYSDNDEDAMNRIFMRSKLYRPKWHKEIGSMTYGEYVIQKAIEGTRETISTWEP